MLIEKKLKIKLKLVLTLPCLVTITVGPLVGTKTLIFLSVLCRKCAHNIAVKIL